jgi:cation diffusion facilitator CzcD-associated flavoprotein CzcO
MIFVSCELHIIVPSKGCGSDISGHWYSLSTELNPHWSSYLVGQPEIQAYWGNLWQKYNLESHTKLGHLVKYAEWNAQLQRYRLEIQKVATGETFEAEAEIIFHALGGFLHPSFPEDIKGIDSFRGHTWHSATWNHDVDLGDKRVGVIGNGCSA